MRPKITVEAGAFIALSCYLLLMPFGWVVSALIAGAVHELGHCTAIWLLDGRVYEIRIGPSGARIETEPLGNRETLFCALAGPVAGGLLCLFMRWVPQLGVCALVQTVFNLLPVYPFDGGRAVMALVGIWKDKAVAKSADSVYNKSDR